MPPMPPMGTMAGRAGVDIAQVVLSHLRSPCEIEAVRHLRDEIDLSVHAAAGSQFLTLEKKETSAGSSSVSACTACR